MATYTTMLEAIDALRAKGYTLDLHFKTSYLECPKLKALWEVRDILVDEVHYFEGKLNAEEGTTVYALSSLEGGAKGLLIDAYDMSLPEQAESLQKVLQAGTTA